VEHSHNDLQTQSSTACAVVHPSPSPSTSLAASPSTPQPSYAETYKIPDHWRPEIEEAIQSRTLSATIRSEIVRVLVDQLYAKSSKPTRAMCEELARALILKYPFMKDDQKIGYVS